MLLYREVLIRFGEQKVMKLVQLGVKFEGSSFNQKCHSEKQKVLGLMHLEKHYHQAREDLPHLTSLKQSFQIVLFILIAFAL